MLLEPDTLDLAPVSAAVLARLDGDPRFKLELPAAQVELITTPTASAALAIEQLKAGRRDLAAAASGLAVPAVAGAHPFAGRRGALTEGARYEEIRREYGSVAQLQLVAALQIHVAVGGASRSLAVYNALRSYLPVLSALAANAPFQEGEDSGLASVRPGICVQLPRQGVPPAFADWEQLTAELSWGLASGAVRDLSEWWWELRLHPAHGTVELRAPDAQTTVEEAAGIVALVQALVATLASGHDRGTLARSVPTWRIQENRWSALRDGVEGHLVDVASGERCPTRECLFTLVEMVSPMARRLGADHLLAHTLASIERNGAMRQRDVGRAQGARGLAAWLAARFIGSDSDPAEPD